jgi:hypothetical protein
MGLAPRFWPAHASRPSPMPAPALSPVPDCGRTLPPHRRRCTAPPYRVCCRWPPPRPRLAKTGSRARSSPTSSHFHSPHPGLLPLQRVAAAAQHRPIIGAMAAPLAPSPRKARARASPCHNTPSTTHLRQGKRPEWLASLRRLLTGASLRTDE